MESTPIGRASGTGLRWFLVAICILAALKFVVRVMPITRLTTGGDQNDLKMHYLSSRAWTRGLDPYDQTVVTRIWIEAGGTPATAPSGPSPLPPSAFVLFSPLAMLPSWNVVRAIWFGLSMAALALLLVCVHRLAGFRWLQARSLCLIAGTLALEPVSNTLWLGQTSILVTAAAAASIVCGLNDRRLASGALEGLGITLKPQLALAFSAPFVLARRWKSCVVTTITILALAWVALRHVGSPTQCVASWLSDLHFVFWPANDTAQLVVTARQLGKDWAASPISLTDFINLQYPLSTFIDNRVLARGLTWGITLVLAGPALRALVRRPTDITLLHSVSLLAVLELLCFYHRGYDAVVLVFPMAWALSPIVPRSQSWPVLLSMWVFFVPIGGTLLALDKLHFIPAWLSSEAVWRLFVLPCQAWALLTMASWLAYCLVCSEVGRDPEKTAGEERRQEQQVFI